jgi:hypothetical protein
MLIILCGVLKMLIFIKYCAVGRALVAVSPLPVSTRRAIQSAGPYLFRGPTTPVDNDVPSKMTSPQPAIQGVTTSPNSTTP